ncbi:WGR domain-containing protein [Methylomonas koyamae]|uniref:WGR domain-containing protein n=1 Tax=Methylomonas koyamae TaxID=702114 RepID=UPI0028C5085E|nr:WGR domain-containing protein [Methylomonas koyamae]
MTILHFYRILIMSFLSNVILMCGIYLERHDADSNIHRFYALTISPGIFSDWSLVREWGRVGSPGTVRSNWYESEEEAIKAQNDILRIKQRRGYTLAAITC